MASGNVSNFSSCTYLSQNSRKRAVSARVRMSLCREVPRVSAARIVINRNPRLLQRQRNIGLLHAEDGDVGESIVLNQ